MRHIFDVQFRRFIMRLINCYNAIIKGPEIWSQISTRSVGINVFETFKTHPNKQELALLNAITNENITYGKLWESTCKLGSYFRKENIGRGDLISVCSENSVNFFTPFISALYEGAATAPINHTYSKSEILHTLNLIKPKIAFCSLMVYDKFFQLYRNGDIPWVRELHIMEDLDKFGLEEIDDYEPKELADLGLHTALVLFSSGTTGLPKGVMLSHETLNARQVQAKDPRLLFNQIDSTVVVFPFYHSFGFNVSFANMRKRKTVLFMDKFNEEHYLSTIQNFKLSSLLTVPTLCVLLAKSPAVDKYNLSSVKEIVSGAAPLSAEVEYALMKRLPNLERITQAYGQTELCFTVLAYDIHDKPRPGSSGRVIAGLEVIVRDPETGEHLGAGKVGELCAKGLVVMQGYYDNEEATNESFTEDGWLRTGDMAYYDEDGYFYIVDRLKELIKYNAFQVPPAQLEALLLTHDAICDAAVVGLPDEASGELPVAFVVAKSNCTITDNDILEFVANQVSKAKRLHHVWFISEIPKTPTGKLLRKDLRKLAIELSTEATKLLIRKN